MRDLDLVLAKGGGIITPQQPTPAEEHSFGSNSQQIAARESQFPVGSTLNFNFTTVKDRIYLGIVMIVWRWRREPPMGIPTCQIINGSETITNTFLTRKIRDLETLVAIRIVKAQGSSITIRIRNDTNNPLRYSMIRIFLAEIKT